MASWTLADIRKKTRQVSGRLGLYELPNIELDKIINQYVRFEFPAEVKLNRNYTFYELNTTLNQRQYTVPETYTNFDPEATIDGQDILYYQNPDQFREGTDNRVKAASVGVGDGTTTGFSTTISANYPIKAGSVLVDDTVESFTDDGAGTLTGSLGGTGSINYSTGALSVTFNTAPSNGQNIRASWISETTGKPQAVLYFNNKFTFFPVPDHVYRFKIKAWSTEVVQDTNGNVKSNFTNANDRPLEDQWGPLIAYGAAKRLHADYGEMEAYELVNRLYIEQVNFALRRTEQDLLNARALPKF